MDLSRLMQLFSSPESIHSLGFSDKISASLITTLFGMGITFSALVILLFIISWMRKLAAQPGEKRQKSAPAPTEKNEEDVEELVAAITTAIVASQNGHNIIIRNIRRVKDFQPQWNRAGIQSQINSNLNA